MRRAARLLLAALGVAGASYVAAQSAPSYPATTTQSGSDSMCILQTLSLGGATLGGTFSSSNFNYPSCTITNKNSVSVSLTTMDSDSHAELWVNGQAVATDSVNGALTNSGGTAVVPASVIKSGSNTFQLLVQCQVMGTGACAYQYDVECTYTPSSGGFVVGDPQFVGLRGQSYQVHGVSGEIYNIVSDVDLQYNSRFVFLNSGECPVVDGRKLKGCWSHPGSYLGELGLKTKAGDRIHLVSGAAKDGFATVEVNGKALQIGDSVLLADNMGSVSLNSTHLASVSVGNWDFAFENSDMFVNQRVRVLDARGLRSHGLLGQTWREATYPNAIKYVQGTVDDYVIRDGDIFGDNFVFNTYN